MKPILIIVAGGTIDAAEYDFALGKVLSFGDPAVRKILKIGRVRNVEKNAEVIFLPQKDSLDMTDEDREKILRIVLRKSAPERILITHGTDTMLETGRLLQKHARGKTIVLTGAMRPNDSPNSDAPFSFGGAWIGCFTLPHGVYIIVDGEIFFPQCAKKNRENPDDPHFENAPVEESAFKGIKTFLWSFFK